jgi:hypothetical protein
MNIFLTLVLPHGQPNGLGRELETTIAPRFEALECESHATGLACRLRRQITSVITPILGRKLSIRGDTADSGQMVDGASKLLFQFQQSEGPIRLEREHRR